MSSILNALKKLENERAGRSPDSLKIDSAILKTADVSQRFSPVSMALLVLLVFMGGATAAYLFLKEPKSAAVLTRQQPFMAKKTTQSHIPVQEVKTETLPEEIVVVPAHKEYARESSHVPPEKPEALSGKPTGAINKAATKAVSGIAEKPKGKPEPTIKEIPAAVPNLRVNGIAFQKSGSDSMAIVNGAPVSNGSTVQGVTVEKILNDRVLFQKNGERFEILLGQSN